MYRIHLPNINAKIRTIQTKQEAEDYFNKALTAKYTAYDYETGGKDLGDALDWNRGYIIGVSFSYSKEEAVYIPIKHQTENAEVGAINTAIEFMKQAPLIAHNFSFEYAWTRAKYGVIPKQFTDTMLLIGVWNANLNCKGLKDFVKHRYNFEMQDFKSVTQKTKDFSRVSVKDGYYYGGSDALWTLRITDDLLPQIEADKGLRSILKLENEVLPILCESHYNGMHIDTKMLYEYEVIIKRNIDAIMEEIKAIFREHLPHYLYSDIFGTETLNININSTKDLLKVYKELGFNNVDETGLAKKQLKQLKHPLSAKLLEFRKEHKLLSMYIEPYKNMVEYSKIIHPGISQIGAETGRMSGYEPNLMQVPKIRD